MTRKFGRLLSAMLHGTLRRMTVPYRNTANEYYRFPWF
jgi:hypothetical protein